MLTGNDTNSGATGGARLPRGNRKRRDTSTSPEYRVVARPGPGLAIIDGPVGNNLLWSKFFRTTRRQTCAKCGKVGGSLYRPPAQIAQQPGSPRLCADCVEGS